MRNASAESATHFGPELRFQRWCSGAIKFLGPMHQATVKSALALNRNEGSALCRPPLAIAP
jgi:hypothetical protein